MAARLAAEPASSRQVGDTGVSLRSEDLQLRYVLRTWRLAIVTGVAFAAILVGYWNVQVVDGAGFRTLADNNRLRELTIPAPRGLILDRKGLALVENVPTYRLRLDRNLGADFESSLAFAGSVLAAEEDELERQLRKQRGRSPVRSVLLAEDLSLSEVARFEAAGLEHPEFEVEVLLRRFYRHGPQTAHLLGYIGEVNEAHLAERDDLKAGDLVGIKGAESRYDESLRGREGRRVIVVDSRGKLVEEHLRIPAERGEDLRLTLDLDLQQEAERFFQGRVGSAIALDPRNGEVLVMVSAPSYNPNLFARRLDRSQWLQLASAPNDPLQNRALQNTYPPGSVFKIITAIAALEEGVVDESYSVFCKGGTRIYNHLYRCWRRGGHGRVDLHQALQHSCDVFFYHLGQKLGIDRLADYARQWGLGRATGIDISGEKSGLVPDRQWSLLKRETMWFPGETISVAIGQGPVLTTPLQIAVMMAAVANGGEILRPHIVRSGKREVVERVEVSPATLAIVHQALWAVVNDNGTAGSARVAGLNVVGKTGTAQVIRQEAEIDTNDLPFRYRDHAWFAAFAPRDNPELVVVVFVEHGGHGSSAAAPLAKLLYERHFGPLSDDLDT